MKNNKEVDILRLQRTWKEVGCKKTGKLPFFFILEVIESLEFTGVLM